MFNKSHIRSRKKLILDASGKIRLHFSNTIRNAMRQLWLRKKMYGSTSGCSLGSIYESAFDQFLFKNKIPKVIPKVDRTTVPLVVSDSCIEKLKSMRLIALKRNQPLSIIVEEALRDYLDQPENYLGNDLQSVRPQERISS